MSRSGVLAPYVDLHGAANNNRTIEAITLRCAAHTFDGSTMRNQKNPRMCGLRPGHVFLGSPKEKMRIRPCQKWNRQFGTTTPLRIGLNPPVGSRKSALKIVSILNRPFKHTIIQWKYICRDCNSAYLLDAQSIGGWPGWSFIAWF